MEITRQQFLEQRHRRFGRANPERMDLPFWEMMVRNGESAYWARKHFEEGDDDADAVWCFSRYGMSQTPLPDGRTVCVAGENEDHYDPDFCIYNDVVVKHPGGPDAPIHIFGYPKQTFPPTDFHSATLAGDRIFLIGNLGYPQDRRPGHTPVYALSLSDFHMTEVPTSGEAPGWISDHSAETDPAGRITVRGGRVVVARRGEQKLRNNFEEFELDPATARWRQTTARNWRQFSIHPELRNMLSWSVKLRRDPIQPAVAPDAVAEGEHGRQAVLQVEGVDVSLTFDLYDIHVVVKGRLPDDLTLRLVGEMHEKAEAWLQGRCELEEL